MVDALNMPYRTAARPYFEAGWSPIPLPYKQKSPTPDNVQGGSAPYVTEAQVAAWLGQKNGSLRGGFRGRPEQARAGNLSFLPGNIALRLPPNIIGIDVDLYDGKAGAETLAAAEARWGSLPPTWISTSRFDGSGIRYFRVPEGLDWKDVGPGVETIKWYHRYAIVFPSIHDKTGKRYYWIRPDGVRTGDGGAGEVEFPSIDELPMLPAPWVAGLTNGQAWTSSGDAGDIDYESAKEWLAEHGAGDMCSVMSGTLSKYTRSVRSAGEDGGAHDQARDGAWALLGDAGAGHTGAEEAIRQLGSVFGTAVATRRGQVWVGEWRRIVIKGCGKVREELRRAGGQRGSDPCDLFSEAIAKPTRAGGSTAFDYKLDDIGNAQRLAAAVGTDTHWVPALGSWSVYDPSTSLWRLTDGNDAMVRAAMEMVRKMDAEAAYIDDPKAFAAFKAFVKASGSSSRIDAMLRLARSLKGIAVEATKFDADDYVLHAANGAVVLGETGSSFRARLHSDFATFATPVPYEAGTRSKVWDKFLREVLPDRDNRRWTQTLLGYTLQGGNPERAFIIAKGLTTSGKSTMVRTVAAALGPYASSYTQHLFREKKDEGPRVDLLGAMLRRFLYCVEGSAEIPWHADVVKRATGNDAMSARRMHSNVYVERVPAFTPWLATNANPLIPNSDRALARRIYAAPFSAVILEEDKKMILRLCRPEVLTAVLAWLVEGWDIYCEDGLTKPPLAALAARQAAVDSLSLFNEFLAECCEEGPEGEGYIVASEDIRLRWIDWLISNGHEDSRMHTSQWIGRRLSDHGLERIRRAEPGSDGDRKVWYRLGVRLRVRSGSGP